MLTLVAVITITLVIGLLLFDKVSPIGAFCLVPVAAALAIGFSPDEIGGFYESGIARVVNVATMFIFAITFFGVLQDAGLFQPIIDGIIRLTRGNVVLVVVGTGVVGMLAHLDGAGATTFLLTIPALLPLYRQLNINPLLMLLVLATGAGIFNMLPWAGPLGRAAAVTGIDVTELWRPLIPIQVIGACCLVGLAALLGLREKRRIAQLQSVPGSGAASSTAMASRPEAEPSTTAPVAEDEGLKRPQNMLANMAIFITVMAVLLAGVFPAGLVFMIGLSVALIVNYPSVQDQIARIRAHAAPALLMGAIILSAGVFLGIMDGSGMLRALSQSLVNVLPAPLLPYLHVVIGFFGLPLEIVLSTDAWYFGLLPVVLEITGPMGISPEGTVYALTIGNIIGTFISPFSPALWLALGLAGQDMGKYIRYALPIMWAFSIVLFVVAGLMGLFA